MTAAVRIAQPRNYVEAFFASAEYKSRVGAHRVTDSYDIELDFPLSVKAAGDPVSLVSIQPGQGTQPVGIPLGIADFISEFPVTASALTVPVQTAIGSEFAPVASAAAKPAVTDTYVSTLVPVETIAGWIRATTQVLDDAAAAGYSITVDLLAAVRRAEENQIINGNGTSPQLKGVLSTAGITAAADLPSAIGAVGSAGYRANMVVVNPADITKVRVNASTAGAFFYDPNRQVVIVYGLAMMSSIAVPVGTAIVADWANASVIWRRWAARIVVGLQNDDIIKNQMTIVGESRLAFLVTHPNGFAKFTVT